METTPDGQQIAVKTVEIVTSGGSLLGIAIAPRGHTVYFVDVDDGDNTLKVFTSNTSLSMANYYSLS